MSALITGHGHEPSGIRDLLEANPVAGERRSGSRRFWTGREEKLLREHYPAGGVSTCLAVLPGRTASSIYNRAGQLGLRMPGADGRARLYQRWETSDQIDAIIRRTFQKAPTKGDVQQCAQTVGRPRHWVSKRAARLGLVSPRFKEPAWSEAELEIIAEQAHKTPAALRKALRWHGFERTETAIIVKLKRLGVDRTDPHNMNANQLAGCMGVDRKSVSLWIAKGWLKATRRAATEKDDRWSIHHLDVARFVVDHLAHVDIRKVDKHWFVDLLIHSGAPQRKANKYELIADLVARRPDLTNQQIAEMVDSTAKAVAVTKSKIRQKQAAPTEPIIGALVGNKEREDAAEY